MKAKTGDHIILAGEQVDRPTRDGEVLEVRGDDGSPPYLVRWRDGHTGLIYPGPGSVLRVADAATEIHPVSGAERGGAVRHWQVSVSIFEAGDDTTATVALVADSPDVLTGKGSTHRGSGDRENTRIGDEVAVARALRHLADDLLSQATHEIEVATGRDDVAVRPR
jgi:Domain of unknown function (DUF1918)/Domain of unknown function (DUF1876)